MPLTRICVFCGSNPGANGAYRRAARDLGHLLAQRGIGLVYGGGITGIMGALAEGVLSQGGEVIGVIPEAMTQVGVAHFDVSELIVVDSMHTRKATMFRLSDAFVALPGGLGTFEELFETMTWSQLGYQPKPIGILNVEGYYDPLVHMIEHAVIQGFVKPQHQAIFTVATTPQALLDALDRFQHPAGGKWTELAET